MVELSLAAERLVEIIRNVTRETGYGPDREELVEITGGYAAHLRGEREARDAGLIRYDENGRFVPC